MKSNSNDLQKGWNLPWCHHFTYIACGTKLRMLRKKQDALRVQTGPFLSKYQGFRWKLKCYKDISFFQLHLNSNLFVCSLWTIVSNVLKFLHVLTSFAIFHVFNIFLAIWPWNLKAIQMTFKKDETWHGAIISHI